MMRMSFTCRSPTAWQSASRSATSTAHVGDDERNAKRNTRVARARRRHRPSRWRRADALTRAILDGVSALLANAPVEQARRIRRDEYDKMVELGLFEDERVELLDGVIVTMSPKGAPHDSAIERLTELLVTRLAGRATVRVQSAFAASAGSQPEPDLAVVPRGDYRQAHPNEALLIIEVADSSLATDRGTKARLYAEFGVAEYWVVNVRDGIVEVHTEIVESVYTRVEPYRAGGMIRLLRFPDVEIAASDVL